MSRYLLIAVVSSIGLSGCTAAAPPAAETKPAEAPAATDPPAMDMAVRTGPVSPPTTEPEMIASALSAAPEAVSRDATIIAMDAKGAMKTLRQGTNQFTCMPDGPSPGVDPMCLDKNGLEWATAWMSHKDPPADKIGFGYMLMGGSDASNTDPFATAPAPGGRWVDTGPHVMVLNSKGRMEGYPTTPDNPKAPYVMFAGTPYEHLMIPVK
jgi:hypothetical protein